MGILRTNEISGLETPIAVTGSVAFDGTGDYLDIGAFHISDSWTMEFWFNTSVNNTIQRPMNFSSNLGGTNYAYIELTSGGKIKARVASAAAFGETPAVTTNEWHHTALSYDGSTAYFVYDGKLIATQSVSYSNNSIQVRFGADESNISSNLFTGYVSNARILSGIALYTTDYTVPVHKLEKIDGTVLLCCNNPDSAGADGTGKTITVNGDAAASTFSPGLTRDFTSGTQFEGVAKFDTQGYFVPPSGTTEQRGGTRGVFYCGAAPARDNRIQYINIESLGNAQEFGDSASGNTFTSGGCGSSTRGVFGASEPTYTGLDFITFASTGNATTFGTIGSNNGGAAVANNTRGVWDRGQNIAMEYITIASLGNAASFGDSSAVLIGRASGASPTRGIFAAGYGPSPFPQSDVIDYITISTLGNAIDFGDISFAHSDLSGFSNSTRMVMGGGLVFPSPTTYYNNIEYITIATTGNSQDFGDLWVAGSQSGSASSLTRGVWAGLNNPSGQLNHIQYVTIATTGNALDFGDLLDGRRNTAGASNGHGGLS